MALLLLALSGCRAQDPGKEPDPVDDTGTPDTDPGDTDSGDSGDTDTDSGDSGCLVQTWYTDADGDGFGAPGSGVDTCTPEAGSVLDATDCNDADPLAHPGATEVCDGDDDNCDGRADLGVVQVWHTDTDGDGFGHMTNVLETCDPPEGYVLDGTDCRPGDVLAYPGARERCNGDDDDCDTIVDEDMDLDGDGHRNEECSDGDDCDDEDPAVHPDAVDACEDGFDADCDGADRLCGLVGDYDLADADARLYGPGPSYDVGRQIDAGDVTGDGVDDLLLSTMYAHTSAGGGYVLSGLATGTQPIDNVAWELAGAAGTTYLAGRSIGIGDVNGDGIGDVGFGAPYMNQTGVYVLFGPVTADRSLGDYDVLVQSQYGSMGGHGSDLGDVNGDGYADAVVGVYSYGTTGATQIVYGPLASGDTFDLTTEADVTVTGTPNSYSGRWVRAGQDFDGDGVGDLLSAAPRASDAGPSSGTVYVVHGPPVDGLSLVDADGTLTGDSASDGFGESIATGDVDGDGLDDALACAAGDHTYVVGGGGLYVFRGPAAGSFDITAADFAFYGASASSNLCFNASVADVDGSGGGDVLVGAQNDNTAGLRFGAAYLFLDPAGGALATTDADASFYGETTDSTTGTGVQLADLDADGLSEVYISAPTDPIAGARSGLLYVVYPAE